MGHIPLLAIVCAKQLGTSHKKDPPTIQPAFCLIAAVGIFQHRKDLIAILIKVLQPVVAGLLVVLAIPRPLLGNFQIVFVVGE